MVIFLSLPFSLTTKKRETFVPHPGCHLSDLLPLSFCLLLPSCLVAVSGLWYLVTNTGSGKTLLALNLSVFHCVVVYIVLNLDCCLPVLKLLFLVECSRMQLYLENLVFVSLIRVLARKLHILTG